MTIIRLVLRFWHWFRTAPKSENTMSQEWIKSKAAYYEDNPTARSKWSDRWGD